MSYYTEPLASCTSAVDNVLVQILIFLQCISQRPMSLYGICKNPLPVHADTYLRSSHEYTQLCVQYPYITMSLDHMFP